jgi:hypothetical protein
MTTIPGPRIAMTRQFANSTALVALMDEAGRWREVPERSLVSVPYGIRMKISPTVALMILADRNGQNRDIERRRVAKYVSDMITGKWEVHGGGLQFNRQGQLIDGQHRLEAVIESNVTVDFMVTFGVEDKAIIAIDEGRPRSNLDVARILGLEGVNKQIMSIASYLLEYRGVKDKRSRSDFLQYVQTHAEALEFVSSRLSARGLVKAPIGAAIVRAYYSCRQNPEKIARLERFIALFQMSVVDIASAGIPDSDNAALALRGFIDASSQKNTGSFRKQMYRKAESALVHFLEHRPASRLYGMAEEQFPMPEDIHEVAV